AWAPLPACRLRPWLSLVLNDLAGALGEANLAPVVQGFETDAGGFAVSGIFQRQVGDVDGCLLGDDATLLLSRLALVPAHQVDPAHQRPTLPGYDLEHLALLALVAAGEHHHLVTLLDLGRRHHSTSGARLTIFMWFLALSSRVTGPKIRVPIGSPCGLISTPPLRSKRMSEPSGRRTPLAVRTTTAFMPSPFLTRPRGIPSLTVTTIVSPIVAYRRLEPPSTLMHCSRRAPELSATSRLVSIWIIATRPRPASAGSSGSLRVSSVERPEWRARR